jgi:hypothetical protein
VSAHRHLDHDLAEGATVEMIERGDQFRQRAAMADADALDGHVLGRHGSGRGDDLETFQHADQRDLSTDGRHSDSRARTRPADGRAP